MKKLSLLVLAGLAAMGTASASRFDVIKDGKLVNGIQMPYPETTTAFDKLEEGKGPDGKDAMVYTHGAGYKEVRIDFKEQDNMPDVTKTWVLGIEYAVNGDVLDVDGDPYSLVSGKKPTLTIGLMSDSKMTDSLPKLQMSDALVCLDFKWYAKADEYRTNTAYLYANPSVKTFGAMLIAFLWQQDACDDKLFIKNLWLQDIDGTERPFYAESFQEVGTGNTVFEGVGQIGLKTTAAEKLSGGVKLTSEGNINGERSWYTDPAKAVNDELVSYDTEDLLYLVVSDEVTEEVAEYGPCEIFIKDLAIPANAEKLYFSSIVSWKFDEKKSDEFGASSKADRAIPMEVRFDNGTTTPLFENDSIGWNFEAKKCEIQVPNGAKSFSVVFKHGKFTYLVDNLQISAFNNVENEDVVVLPTSKAVIYVANDEVVSPNAEKIEIISLAGAVVASANEASVNIAALPAGVYVVKVANAEGISVAKIIKK